MASIQKIKGAKGTAFKITVTNGMDSTGKQIRRYMTWRPDRPMTDKQAMKEARQVAYKFEMQLEQGFAADSRQTVAQYAEYVLSLKEEKGDSNSTIHNFKKNLKRILPEIGHMRLNEVRPQHLTNFYKRLAMPGEKKGTARATAKGRLQDHIDAKGMTWQEFADACGISYRTLGRLCNGDKLSLAIASSVSAYLKADISRIFEISENKAPLSKAVILDIHNTVNVIFAQAKKEMLVEHNPARRATIPVISNEERQPNYFQPDQLREILAAADDEPLMWQTMVYLFATSGCRRGEILALTWEKIDFENKRILVSRSLSYTPENGIVEGPTKTRTPRYVALPDETLWLLRRHQAKQEQDKEFLGDTWENSGYVFTTRTGGPIHPTNVNSWLDHFAWRHSLPKINPHALRHSFASIAIAEGSDIVTVSKTLGHAKPSMTLNVYSHVIEETQRKATENVANSIFRYKEGG